MSCAVPVAGKARRVFAAASCSRCVTEITNLYFGMGAVLHSSCGQCRCPLSSSKHAQSTPRCGHAVIVLLHSSDAIVRAIRDDSSAAACCVYCLSFFTPANASLVAFCINAATMAFGIGSINAIRTFLYVCLVSLPLTVVPSVAKLDAFSLCSLAS